MTDKQIMIDGADVSGCPFFEDERKLLNPAGQELNFKNICSLSFYNFTDFDKDFLCNQSPNCYYKQLKRKEQECEELKKDNAILFDKAMETRKENTALQVQLDQLKADNKHLNGLLDQALKELEEHRDVFEKIKELIQKEIDDCEHCYDCTNCEYNCCTKQILQICDEVNDER